MKKMMMAMALFLTITGSAFANNTEEVNPKVIKAFKSTFMSVSNVSWTIGADYYKASFTYNNKNVFAYYSSEGKFMGLSRFMSTTELPLMLQTGYKKKYADYWVTDLFELANSEGTTYYMTLENAEEVIVVKASPDTDWTTFKKDKKD